MGTGYKASSLGKKVSYMNYGFIVKMLGGCKASVGIYSFNFRRFERPCKSELFEITIYISSYDFLFFGLLLAYSGLFFGPKLKTSQLLLHTIAMMAMRIGMAFTFFLAMTVKTVGNWPIFGPFWSIFGPKLETLLSFLHTKTMRIGTAFTFFIVMTIEAIANWSILVSSCA